MRPPPQPLSADRLLAAYRRGWFPMADPLTGAIEWFNPDPRAIFPLEAFHVPESLARVVRAGRFDIRCDTSFEQIVRSCAAPRETDDLTWIDERIVSAYVSLHEAGHAHSVEAWREDRLVAGLYGVHIGAAFMGESMFRLDERIAIDASKVCLVHLVRWLQHRGFLLLDTQFYTDHLGQFGCVEIRRTQYLGQLAEAIRRDVPWGEFSATDEDS
jgi:leucyl/phenylalanyl-tRNA--protein transferase